MGYDLDRIVGAVDDELKCGICGELLENPVQISDCEHIFCGNCIKEWLGKKLICPIDCNPVVHSQIRAAPKLIINFISKLNISCQFVKNGCEVIQKVDQIVEHINSCEYNPKKMITCKNGCGTLLPDSQQSKHSLICQNKYGMPLMNEQLKEMASLESRMKTMEIESQNMRKQINALKNMMGFVDKDSNNSSIQTKGKLIVKINDKNVIIDVDPREPISVIKQKVQQMENIDSEEMLLFFSNKELEDNKSLFDYRIYRLHNPLLLFMVKKKFKILVRIDREKQYPLELSPKDTVGDVLAKILKKEAVASKELVLCFRNQELEQNRTLFSYKIRDGNFVFLNTRREIEERRVASSQ